LPDHLTYSLCGPGTGGTYQGLKPYSSRLKNGQNVAEAPLATLSVAQPQDHLQPQQQQLTQDTDRFQVVDHLCDLGLEIDLSANCVTQEKHGQLQAAISMFSSWQLPTADHENNEMPVGQGQDQPAQCDGGEC